VLDRDLPTFYDEWFDLARKEMRGCRLSPTLPGIERLSHSLSHQAERVITDYRMYLSAVALGSGILSKEYRARGIGGTRRPED
jgi:hypothetical protein